MSHNLVVIGGKAPTQFEVKKQYDKIICADSGYDTALAYNLVPTLVVGDFDSTVRNEELEKLGYKGCSHDKDETDTELALMKLYPEDTYDLVGGGEGRMDHLLTIFSLFYRYNPPQHWYTHSEELILVEKEISLTVEPNISISLIPIRSSEKVWVNTQGLVWELQNFEISAASISISNRAKEKTIKIVSTGSLFCVLNRNKEEV